MQCKMPFSPFPNPNALDFNQLGCSCLFVLKNVPWDSDQTELRIKNENDG